MGAALIVWVLLALGLLLAPAPREWGSFGRLINAYYDQARPVLQPAAHIVLMAVGVVLLMPYFACRSPRMAVLMSVATTLLFAMVFEMLQSVLPSSFARQCDVADLVPSGLGMLAGGAIGFRKRLKNEDESK